MWGTTQDAHLSLLGWYPELDSEHFYKIIPNEYDAPAKANGKFIFPTGDASGSYELFANWDSSYEDGELSEASAGLYSLPKRTFLCWKWSLPVVSTNDWMNSVAKTGKLPS